MFGRADQLMQGSIDQMSDDRRFTVLWSLKTVNRRKKFYAMHVKLFAYFSVT